MKHVVSIEDLDNKRIMDLLKRAKQLVPVAEGKKKSKALDGKILATCFFEPSTRTRLSFESAMQRLGGTCIGFADPSATSHLKGETLLDAIRMVAGYSDVIVLRHPHEGSAKLASEVSEVPVINGGDGAGQHPTQSLTDLYTIQKECGEIDGKRIAFDVEVDLDLSVFYTKVLKTVLTIPYGETSSYKEIARKTGNPKCFRAVGNANAQNPIPLIIPCHRVIKYDGSIGGYRGKLERKVFLLKHEKNNHQLLN